VSQVDTSRSGIRQPPAAVHHDAPDHGHGIDPMVGVHFGYPAGASADLGFKVWLGDRAPGAAFATVEPGAFVIRYGVGYLVTERADLTPSTAVTGGTAVRLTQLRAWTNTVGVASGVRYTGAELTEMFFFFSARAGAYVGRRMDGRRVWLGSFDVGLGF
jgi:hypothetical protein